MAEVPPHGDRRDSPGVPQCLFSEEALGGVFLHHIPDEVFGWVQSDNIHILKCDPFLFRYMCHLHFLIVTQYHQEFLVFLLVFSFVLKRLHVIVDKWSLLTPINAATFD